MNNQMTLLQLAEYQAENVDATDVATLMASFQVCLIDPAHRPTERTVVMSGAILTPRAAALERIKAHVLGTLPSSESKRACGHALDDFFRWCGVEAIDGFTRAPPSTPIERTLKHRCCRPRLSTNDSLQSASLRWRRPTTASCRISKLPQFQG